MCTQSPILKTVAAYLTDARLLLGALHCDDFHAHGLAVQRLIRFIPGVSPAAVDLSLAQAVVALEAGYVNWTELEHNAAIEEMAPAFPVMELLAAV